MYNPDFWEVTIDQSNLEQIPNEAGLWHESIEDRESRYRWEERVGGLISQLEVLISDSLTQKQCEAVTLYFRYGKTQREVAQIMGISCRVVSQHLFGITRNGKSVGGAIKKIRKLFIE